MASRDPLSTTAKMTWCLSPRVTVTTIPVCSGTPATLTAETSGCNAKSYQWYSGTVIDDDHKIAGEEGKTFTTSTAGTYSVVVTCDTGCTGVGSGSPEFTPNPTVTVTTIPVCSGTPATLTAETSGCNAKSYQWYSGTVIDDDHKITGEVGKTYTTSNPGTYSVVVTCDTGCTGVGSGSPEFKPCPEGKPKLKALPNTPCSDGEVTVTADTTEITGGIVEKVILTYYIPAPNELPIEPMGATEDSVALDHVAASVEMSPVAGQPGIWTYKLSQPGGTTLNFVATALAGNLPIGESSDTVTVEWLITPTVTVGDVQATVGQSVTLTADTTGSPCAISVNGYQWYKGSSVASGSKIEGATTNTYTITDVQPDQAGDYTCQVICDIGCPAEDYGTLEVKAKPEQTFSLSGHKFYDVNNNHVWDEGEPAIPGWEIKLVKIDSQVQGAEDQGLSINTNEDGYYEFLNLPVGIYSVIEGQSEGWTQTYPPEKTYEVELSEANPSEDNLDFGNYKPFMGVKKTASVTSVAPGESITYTIEICNDGEQTLEDVVAKDVFDGKVIITSVSPPTSADGLWHIGNLEPGDCVYLSITALVPETETKFGMEQGVSGTGFVNVHNDLNTNMDPYGLTNCIYVTSKFGPLVLPEESACASVTVNPNRGTELKTREHGSGFYQSEEITSLESKNRSIVSNKSLTATYAPTTFALPNDRQVNYTTRWIEKSKSKNWATGASLSEEYLHANRIERDSTIKLDENGSTSTVDVNFEGVGHLGALKRDVPSTKTEFDYDPTFESREDYVGAFHVYEKTDEYGENVAFDRSVEGQGFVSSDQRVRSSQRTYESGTGSYDTQEMIRTHTNYIAKDINLTHTPTSYTYSPNLHADQDIKWKEGIWSKSSGNAGGIGLGSNASAMGGDMLWASCPNTSAGYTSYIGEEYNSLDYLTKSTEARGLNEMNTEASFSGQADFAASVRNKNRTEATEIDDEERYIGEYTVSRKVELTGVSKYDTPHISVAKTGDIFEAKYNKTLATLARYTITVTNDGNRELEPVYVEDIFPAGAVFINASVRPESLSSKSANWTLTHLAIGGQSTISVLFNVTKSVDLVNIVQVAGAYDDKWVTAANYTVIERNWLQCCPPDIQVIKTADVIGEASILYTVTLKSNANYKMAATVTDYMPAYLTMDRATIAPQSYESGRAVWTFLDIAPGETRTIQYSATASRNGQYTNQVHVEASALDGTGSATADDSITVAIGGTSQPARTTRYGGWQPPDEFGLNTSEEGLVI